MSATIICGDVRDVLLTLPSDSVQCVITSPPYWGLRDYGTGLWEGGDTACDHVPKRNDRTTRNRGNLSGSLEYVDVQESVYRVVCGRCGARRVDRQIGLEPTPDEYISNIVTVFREVRRVLREDGTLWLNLGDCYFGSGKGLYADGLSHGTEVRKQRTNKGSINVPHKNDSVAHNVLKPKDLIGIPWRVAFALQEDGWYLRSDIIWHKPNAMPESVRDRPAKSHEYLFLMAKSGRYFYDADAIAEPIMADANGSSSLGGKAKTRHTNTVQEPRKQDLVGKNTYTGFNERWSLNPTETRNKRTVWTIPTHPYHGAHFATFPPALVEPCILAGSRVGDTILDPFAGSGTVGVVALRYRRSFIGVDLNPEYVQMAHSRISGDAPLLNEVEVLP